MEAVSTTAMNEPVGLVRRLLDEYPGAILVATTPEGMPIPVPVDVPVPRERCVQPRGLESFATAGLKVLADGLLQARACGCATVRLRFNDTTSAFSTMVTTHFIDAIAGYGVMLTLVVPDDDSGTLARLHTEPVTTRIGRMVRDGLGIIYRVDDALASQLGYRADELVGRRSIEFVHDDDRALALASWQALMAEGGTLRRLRLRYRAGAGDYIWFEITSTNLVAEGREVVSDFVDISAQMHEQERLADRERLLHHLTEALPLGVLCLDSRRAIAFANRRLPVLLGQPVPAELEQLVQIFEPACRLAFERALSEALSGLPSQVQVVIAGAGDQTRVCDVTVECLAELRASGSAEAGPGAIVCFTEVTESLRLRQQLEFEATHDFLTGCLNRAEVLRLVGAATSTEKSIAGGLAAVFVDLNLFKDVNDRYGHAAGDELLRAVGARLQALLRDGDAVGRIGGDEFLMLFRRVTTLTGAQIIGDRVAAALNGRIRLAAGPVEVTASVGVSWVHGRSTSADDLVAAADAAMYRAKRAGQHRAVVQAPDRERA